MASFVQQLPLTAFDPLRRWGATYPRHHPLRRVAIPMLKHVSKRRLAYREVKELRPLDAPEIALTPCDSMVFECIYWYGLRGYEGVLADVWAALCEHSRATLEVGANIGIYSIIGARAAPAADYLAVEPSPRAALVARSNFALNGLTSIRLLEAAAVPGPDRGMVALSIPPEAHGIPVGSHLAQALEVDGRATAATVHVDGIPMHELAQGRDLIKIDAEGVEYELIDSIRAPILRERPAIVVEVLPHARELARLLRELAVQAPFLIFVVPAWGSDRLIPIDPEQFSSETARQFNSKDVLLCRTNQVDLLRPFLREAP